jgi:transcriptional regulator with XRE-family HTH domain
MTTSDTTELIELRDATSARMARMVRVLMQMRGVTGAELARSLGVTRQAVSDRLRDRIQFTAGDVAVLAKVLGVSADMLFQDPDDMLGMLSEQVRNGSRCYDETAGSDRPPLPHAA